MKTANQEIIALKGAKIFWLALKNVESLRGRGF